MFLHVYAPVLEGDSAVSSLSESMEGISIDSPMPEETGNINGDSLPGDKTLGHDLANESASTSPDLRAYQQEMLDESLKGNVIVSVSCTKPRSGKPV